MFPVVWANREEDKLANSQTKARGRPFSLRLAVIFFTSILALPGLPSLSDTVQFALFVVLDIAPVLRSLWKTAKPVETAKPNPGK